MENKGGRQGPGSESLRRRGDVISRRIARMADSMVSRGILGIAVRIMIPGLEDPILVNSGVADMTTGQPLGGQELFPIASQSKMFTAAAILLLEKWGQLQFSDPVSKYVQDVPAVGSDATIDQFLNHTSGIGNFISSLTGLPYPWPTFSYDDLMAMARIHGQQSAPGARFDYNNTDVLVLARIIEVVSGLSRSQFLRQHIFKPLGMQDTFVTADETWPANRMAHGYYRPSQGYDGPPIDVSSLRDFSIASAAGDIISSLADMTRWADALLPDRKLLDISINDFSQNIADIGAEPRLWFWPRTYGRGAECWPWAGRQVWGHRGSFFGYQSGTFLDPGSGVVVSLFLTTLTEGSLMQFIDVNAHDYMALLEACFHGGIDVVELP